MPDWSSICRELEAAGVELEKKVAPEPVSGGDISAAWRIKSAGADIFLKTGGVDDYPMFTAEADGLAEIAAANAVRVPRPLAVGRSGDDAFIALTWLDFERADSKCERRLGERLAAMHRTVSQQYGWHRDNTIGRTPQINKRSTNWCEFFAEHRLGYQLGLAGKNGYAGALLDKGTQLLERLPSLFEGYEPAPSLLHGDLWAGNWAASDGEPVIFDPAVWYGDRETDIAMTRLFGGFGEAFYEAYESAWPPSPGSAERQPLYQLYHVLNHVNLFGSGYLRKAQALIARLL